MTRHEKALLLFAAENLTQRSQNSRTSIKTDAAREEGAAWAFQVAAEYLQGLVAGNDKHPAKKELEAMLPDLIKRSEVWIP